MSMLLNHYRIIRDAFTDVHGQPHHRCTIVVNGQKTWNIDGLPEDKDPGGKDVLQSAIRYLENHEIKLVEWMIFKKIQRKFSRDEMILLTSPLGLMIHVIGIYHQKNLLCAVLAGSYDGALGIFRDNQFNSNNIPESELTFGACLLERDLKYPVQEIIHESSFHETQSSSLGQSQTGLSESE